VTATRSSLGRPGPLASRAGGALILVLLLLLAVTALGHGALLLALEETASARASVAVAQARLLAEGGVRRGLRAAGGDTLPEGASDGLTLGEGGGPDVAYRVDIRAVSREVFRVEGTGRATVVRGGARLVQDRALRLLWALSPLERLLDFGAGLEYGAGLEADPGSIQSWQLREAGTLAAPAGCLDRRADIDSVLVGAFPGAVGRSFVGAPGSVPALGLLGHDSLWARLPLRATGSVTPGPVTEAGRCVLLGHSWGSPHEPGGPCGGHRPAVAADGDLTLSGGQGQGLLLVAGTLRMTAGAHYAGLVLVGGDLVLEGGAVLEGMARVRGGVQVRQAASFSARVCPALLALEATPALRHPLSVPGTGWIRPL